MADPGHLASGGARTLFAFGIIFPVLSTLFVAGRFYSHRLKERKWGFDDAFIVVALVSRFIDVPISE